MVTKHHPIYFIPDFILIDFQVSVNTFPVVLAYLHKTGPLGICSPEKLSTGPLVFSLLGKAASEVFWWLGIGWYQFVTLISWLNVFLLTR